MSALVYAASWSAALVDKTPTPDQTVAGPVGFAFFIGGIIAVALLGWSLSRHLKKAQRNADAGMFDPSDNPRRRRQLPPRAS